MPEFQIFPSPHEKIMLTTITIVISYLLTPWSRVLLEKLTDFQLVNKYTILCRRLRDGNPCLKDQLEDLNHVGKMTVWKI